MIEKHGVVCECFNWQGSMMAVYLSFEPFYIFFYAKLQEELNSYLKVLLFSKKFSPLL